MPLHSDQSNQFKATISSGGSLSNSLDLSGWNLPGMIVSPSGTSMLAGSISFQVSVDNSTFFPLNDSTNTLISVPHGTSGVAYGAAAIQAIAPYRYIRFLDSSAQPTGSTITIPEKLI